MSTLKIMQEFKSSFDFSKDVVSKNLVNYVRSNRINLSPNELERLLAVVDLSIDESFQKRSSTLENFINKQSSDKPSKKK